MWSNLPFDLLSNIFSHLSPDSFARAKATCRNWHSAAEHAAAPPSCRRRRQPPWFLAMPTRSRGLSNWFAHNPISNNWHVLPFDDIITYPIRSIATTNNGLVLLKVTSTTSLKLAICNPFTRQFRQLSQLSAQRTNPAVGIVEHSNRFKIYVAGGTSVTSRGGAAYQLSVEMYESSRDTWQIVGDVSMEYAVRLTVWTPNESVYSNGVLYWMTSARAYCIMGFEIETNEWRELSVPMADRLEFATLFSRNGNLALVGGTCVGGVCLWELGKDDVWILVEKVPFELGVRFLGDEINWSHTKCVGIDSAICLYRDIGSGIIVWREVLGNEGKWEWNWIEGCSLFGDEKVRNFPVKGLLMRPNLARSVFFSS